MEFEFKEVRSYESAIFCESNVVKLYLDNNEICLWGGYTTYPSFVYAVFNYQTRWATEKKQWHGYALSRHFINESCDDKFKENQAKEWLNFLLTNPPTNYRETTGVAGAPDIEGGEVG